MNQGVIPEPTLNKDNSELLTAENSEECPYSLVAKSYFYDLSDSFGYEN